MRLDQFVIELLRNNNCVIVPNFGGFIANYKPASIDKSRNKIFPPSKQVLFNPKLANNDGLLANYVAQKRELSYSNAVDFIDVKVQEWQLQIQENNRVEFGEIGFLFKQDGQIIFEQNRELNLLLSAYGLASIRFVQNRTETVKPVVKQFTKPVAEVKPIPEIELSKEAIITEKKITEKKTVVIDINTNSKPGRKWGRLAVACLIPALFYSYWIPIETDALSTGQVQLSDFNPFSKNSVKLYATRITNESFNIALDEEVSFNAKIESLPPSLEIYNYEFDDELYIPIRLNKVFAVEVDDHINSESKNSEIITDGLTIQVITGCFSVKENAKNLVNQLKSLGYNSKVFDKKNGLYRVSAGAFSSMSKAKNEKHKLADENFPSWILKS